MPIELAGIAEEMLSRRFDDRQLRSGNALGLVVTELPKHPKPDAQLVAQCHLSTAGPPIRSATGYFLGASGRANKYDRLFCIATIRLSPKLSRQWPEIVS